ncbi:uncharacterized protein EAE98_009989 [Botrytis deweyae]|uniref:Uncharacterized protein n=1 Tax=Botrytis deweyae TaxID=2478750 RepID=A0ABQ7IA56_9HELO|nr:uncharacterized protein EAE98_009989 [Botrytis deweyae]KAF7917961.1 hypothetical protein EAE98_009989 [Botrytis deweyae]
MQVARSLSLRRFGDSEIWRFGDLEIWRFGDLEIWKVGKLESWMEEERRESKEEGGWDLRDTEMPEGNRLFLRIVPSQSERGEPTRTASQIQLGREAPFGMTMSTKLSAYGLNIQHNCSDEIMSGTSFSDPQEGQALARIYRIGQTRSSRARKLVVENTFMQVRMNKRFHNVVPHLIAHMA